MASYLPPQVDHQLYNPVLPQSPVAEIFQLMGVKQQMYDSNLARVNTQISSMNELSSAVSNTAVKEKVENFNKEANDILRQYTNLDFSIRDNVNAIDRLYDPLINDEDFNLDYTATTHERSELQKGFNFRDSNKKEERELFSVTNMNYVIGASKDLKDAKNTKELRLASSKVKDRYYVPFRDVKKNAMDNLFALIKEGKAEMSTSTATGGYIVTMKNGNVKGYPQALDNWLQASMSEQDIQQLKIESTVALDQMINQNGKEKVVTDYIQSSLDSSNEILKEVKTLSQAAENELKVLLPLSKMNKNQKKDYYEWQSVISQLQSKEQLIQNKISEIQKTQGKLQNDTFNYDDILDLAIDELTHEKLNEVTSNLANSFGELNKGDEIKEDTAYTHAQSLKFNYANLTKEYAKLTQDRLIEDAKLKMEQKKINKDLAIAGLKYDDATGEYKSNTFTTMETVEDVNDLLDNLISSKGGTSEARNQLKNNFISLWEQKHGGKKNNWNTPEGALILKKLLDPNYDLSNWDPDYQKLKERTYSNYESNIEAYTEALNEKKRVFDMYKKEHPETTLKFDAMSGEVIGSDKGVNYSGTDYINPAKMLLHSIWDPTTSGIPGYDDQLIYGSANEEELKDFQNYMNVNGNAKIFAIENRSATGAAGKQLLKELTPSLDQFQNSYSPEVNDLSKYNTGVDEDVLDLAYQGVYRSSGLNKTGTDKDKDINPRVKYGMRYKGTNIAFPGMKIEDIFEQEDGKKYTDEQIQAYNLITTKGLNLPLNHNDYTEVNSALAKVNEGESVSSGNSFKFRKNLVPESPTGADAYVLYPNEDQGHYHYEITSNSVNVKIPVEANYIAGQKEPYFSLMPTTAPVYVNQSQGDALLQQKQLKGLSKPLTKRINEVETDEWSKKFTAYIKEHPEILIQEGGEMFVPYNKIKTLIPD